MAVDSDPWDVWRTNSLHDWRKRGLLVRVGDGGVSLARAPEPSPTALSPPLLPSYPFFLPSGRTVQRTQRCLIPTDHSTRALISQHDLCTWVADLEATGSSSSSPRPSHPSLLTRTHHAGHQELVLFSLNDYLGLSAHADVRSAVASSSMGIGMGPRSSAIVAGYTCTHRDLELGLASLKETEDCLLFPTGFAANMAVISALMGGSSSTTRHGSLVSTSASTRTATGTTIHPHHNPSPASLPPVVLSDELNHASIIDGARLGARSHANNHANTSTSALTSNDHHALRGKHVLTYRHRDLDHLESLLAQVTATGRRALVVTDSLFSMDGDVADLRGLAKLKQRYPFLLVVDEAHATLVYGDRGGGVAEDQGVQGSVDVHVGTLSKAFGGMGGFVACGRGMKTWLQNAGRAYMFSTGLPVPVAAGALAALGVSQREPEHRERLWRHVGVVAEGLGLGGKENSHRPSPILPVVVGDAGEAARQSACLLREGWHVPAIRPPTVPNGTSRLRISLSAAHSDDDVAGLVRAVRAVGAGGGEGGVRAKL